MKINKLLTILLVLISVQISAQRFTVSGYVTDATTGENLLNASVYNPKTYKGTVCNNFGFYSLSLSKGKYTITYSYIGYAMVKKEVDLSKDTKLNIELQPNLEIEEVVVEESRIQTGVNSSRMSVTEVPINAIKQIPVFLGEADIVKAIQLLPGVQAGVEGTSSFYVRGGGPDQNLILLDGVPVYNANHLFGFMSVFNTDAIQSVSLTKGGFPARYGGRLSSVLDIRMKEGNTKETAGKVSVGLISSSLTLEGPIGKKGNSSYMLAGRRSYIDALAQPIIMSIAAIEGLRMNVGYYLYDLNLKVNHKLNSKNKIYLSAYIGRDKAYSITAKKNKTEESRDNYDMHWGNFTASLRWNSEINNKLFSKLTLSVTDYNAVTGIKQFYQNFNNEELSDYHHKYSSGITDYSLRTDFDYYPVPKHSIKAGANLTNRTFNPGVQTLQVEETYAETYKNELSFGNEKIIGNEFFVYAEDDWDITKRLRANLGVHVSAFHVQNKTYSSVQPRASARFMLLENWSVKAAYSKMAQYAQLLSTSTVGAPTDLWMPTTKKIAPQLSTQYAVGSAITFGGYSFSAEAYYKEMYNLLEYKEGVSFFDYLDFENPEIADVSLNIEDKIEIGNGWSYGAEFLFEKKKGKTTGWVGYTLAWAWRQFDENISSGKPFPARYDRRHDIGISISHRFSEKLSLTGNWTYGSGYPVTLALQSYTKVERYFKEQRGWTESWHSTNIKHLESRNNYRMPSYHRLDLGLSHTKSTKRNRLRTWNFSLYNAYNRQNPFFIFHEYYFGEVKIKQQSLLPIVPSLSYNLKF